MAEAPVAVALVQQETVRAVDVTGSQILVHKEGLAGAGGAQQEHVVVYNQSQFKGHLLDVEAHRNEADAVAKFQDTTVHSGFHTVVQADAQGRLQGHGHILAKTQAALVAGYGGPELCRSVGYVPNRRNTHLRKGCHGLSFSISRQDA